MQSQSRARKIWTMYGISVQYARGLTAIIQNWRGQNERLPQLWIVLETSKIEFILCTPFRRTQLYCGWVTMLPLEATKGTPKTTGSGWNLYAIFILNGQVERFYFVEHLGLFNSIRTSPSLRFTVKICWTLPRSLFPLFSFSRSFQRKQNLIVSLMMRFYIYFLTCKTFWYITPYSIHTSVIV